MQTNEDRLCCPECTRGVKNEDCYITSDGVSVHYGCLSSYMEWADNLNATECRISSEDSQKSLDCLLSFE